jgi:aspartate-semialdehyde dehydrogenase
MAQHPLFEITGLAASPRNAGKTYAEALTAPSGMTGWMVPGPLPASLAKMKVLSGAEVKGTDFDVAFSAVEADVAREIEPRLARDIPVFSAASAFRYEDDVPLIIPPVNAAHASMVREQQKRRGFKGYILPIPNCTTTGLAITLAPLEASFGVQSVIMTSMQAMSGAGRSPGVIGLDILDNVIPYIPKEEGKVEVETKKILGSWKGEGTIVPHAARISCTCTRVAVLDGHTETVFVSLKRKATPEQVAAAMREWQGDAASRNLASAPPRWIEVLDDPFRPQPRVDRETSDGMATSVGRIREDSVLENGVKYVLVSHNTKMGAAKGALLAAELLSAQGLLSAAR